MWSPQGGEFAVRLEDVVPACFCPVCFMKPFVVEAFGYFFFIKVAVNDADIVF